MSVLDTRLEKYGGLFTKGKGVGGKITLPRLVTVPILPISGELPKCVIKGEERMRYRLETLDKEIDSRATETEVRNTCRHYWIIESPNGSSSKGVCKFCNEEREFINSLLRYDYPPVTERYNKKWRTADNRGGGYY